MEEWETETGGGRHAGGDTQQDGGGSEAAGGSKARSRNGEKDSKEFIRN